MLDLDYLNSIESYTFLSNNFALKLNSIIVLMRDLDVRGGYCNSTRLIVLEVISNYIKAQILNGTEHNIILIPKILCMSDETDLRFVFTRLHFVTFNRDHSK